MIHYRYAPGQFDGFIIERSKNGGKTWHPIGEWCATEDEARSIVDHLNELEE